MASKEEIKVVKRLAESIGLRSGMREEQRKKRKSWKLAEIEKDLLTKLYEAGFGMPTLAKAVGVDTWTIYALLKTRTVIRSKPQSAALRKALSALGRDFSVEEVKRRLEAL